MPDTSASMPRIGDLAPDFTAVTTHSAAMHFSEWQGDSWVVLFSHPADFTPVCSTELMEFAKRSDKFAALNTKLIGLSVDSVHSHLAWVQNIKEKLGVEITYPLIADLDTKVAQLFGMIHAGAAATATVRAVFFIDPKHVIRAMIHYPMNAGRNIEEIIRLITALQTADKYACALPVNWRPGDKVMVPPPKTMHEVAERLSHAGDNDVKDFYLSFRDQPLGHVATAGQRYDWAAVKQEQLNPLLTRQAIHGDSMTVARISLKKGCVVPEHSHPNEQISMMEKGALKFVFGKHEIVVKEGQTLRIPSNVPHSAEALEDSLATDLFSPPRQDWIRGDDAYLRGGRSRSHQEMDSAPTPSTRPPDAMAV